ncbi:hypothetical protein L3Y34_016877 [Caenorhabditis briggsae]|uniref:Ubiquitin-like domain-containing protein n=1 Tax=Caenorhabditis briggsae TaxID=6238 RepID=A0AAE9DG69_CAEBR|nr:hypothetical protein L3Y34_016877 [Caenorhabditis briggsae]
MPCETEPRNTPRKKINLSPCCSEVSNSITINVESSVKETPPICVLVNRNFNMGYLMNEYAKTHNIVLDTLTFVYIDRMVETKIEMTDTPITLKIRDGGTIRVIYDECSSTGKPSENVVTVPCYPSICSLNNCIEVVLEACTQDTHDISVHVSPEISMGSLMTAYAINNDINLESLTFYYKGRFIKGWETPAKLELKHGSLIRVLYVPKRKNETKRNMGNFKDTLSMNIKVMGHPMKKGGCCIYRMDYRTRMGRLMESYAGLIGVSKRELRFFYNDYSILGYETLNDLGIDQKEEATIRVMRVKM